MDKTVWPYVHEKDEYTNSCCAVDKNGHLFFADLNLLGEVCPVCDTIYRLNLGDGEFKKAFEERVEGGRERWKKILISS